MNQINKCPIWGKYPKIKRDFVYETSGFGAWCIIQCKPIFGKSHLKIEEGKATWDRAFKYAIKH
jgi:hypothetical protein